MPISRNFAQTAIFFWLAPTPGTVIDDILRGAPTMTQVDTQIDNIAISYRWHGHIQKWCSFWFPPILSYVSLVYKLIVSNGLL